MTRSENMEHVEVLRELRSWMASVYWDSRVDALDAAIASLSAPQPPAEAQERPAKPAECADGCPDQQVCDHCQWPPGPDAEAQPVACDWPSCDCTNGRAECGRKISQTPSASVRVEALRDLRDRVIPAALRHHASGNGYIEEAQEIVNRALAQQPAAEPRSTHRVWRRNDWLPCYCEATSDHHIGCEQPAAVDGVDWRAMYRHQTAMRYMDNDRSLTKERAYRMADNDVAALAAQQGGEK